MFAGLDKFKKEAFFKDHQTFTFDTLYEHHTYQIWAVFKTSANLDQGFPYHQFSDAATQEEFDAFVSTVKSMQFYETGVTPQFGDKMIALSTCEYSLDNGRFVVCAVRVDD
jgi:sortase B